MNSLSETTPPNREPFGASHANRTGNSLEQYVEWALQKEGYDQFTGLLGQLFDNRLSVGGKQYAKQVPCGTSIYETQRKCDFLVLNKDKFPEGLVIECKWQQSAGSVDEKYPFAYFNIIKMGVPTIILLDGGGCKPAAMKWLKDQVNPNRALIGVYSMAEFQKLVNNGFLG